MDAVSKIFSLDAPPFYHRRNERYVLCHGCFDLLHVGHIKYLENAKAHGDILIVTVTADQYVNKGTNRPIYSEENRAYMLAALACVDYVAISHSPTAVYALHKIRPDIFAKGIDYQGKGIIKEEDAAIKAIGAKLVFTTSDKFSTTEIIEKCRNVS